MVPIQLSDAMMDALRALERRDLVRFEGDDSENGSRCHLTDYADEVLENRFDQEDKER